MDNVKTWNLRQRNALRRLRTAAKARRCTLVVERRGRCWDAELEAPTSHRFDGDLHAFVAEGIDGWMPDYEDMLGRLEGADIGPCVDPHCGWCLGGVF